MSYQHEHTPVYTPTDGYNHIASLYHTYHKKLNTWDFPIVSRYLPRSLHQAHVLDIWGGDGRWATLLHTKQYASRTIIDSAQLLLDRAPSWVTKICHDVREEFPIATHAYDLILCMFVLSHLDEIDVTLREAKRCLAPWGRMMIVHQHERRPYIHRTDTGEIKIKHRHRRHEDVEETLRAMWWEVDLFPLDESTKLFCCFA